MKQNISSAMIAVIITLITFFLLQWSYNDTDELKESEKEFICTKIDCGDENIEIPKPDQDFIDDIRGALEEPDIFSDTNEQFVSTLDSCIDHVYKSVSVDYQLPKEMIVAKAILESGWGKSRFAKEYNALFGEYTYDQSQGFLPLKREFWDKHYVKSFSSYNNSVSSYFKNINSHNAYKDFRAVRKIMRLENNFSEAIFYFKKARNIYPDRNVTNLKLSTTSKIIDCQNKEIDIA